MTIGELIDRIERIDELKEQVRIMEERGDSPNDIKPLTTFIEVLRGEVIDE